VERAATSLGLPIYQPETLRYPKLRGPLLDAMADVFVVAAFGLIFGPRTLSIPTFGCLNLHASILPAFRGASPVTAAILSGLDETGVTLMRMDAGLDTGPVLADAKCAIEPADTTESLTTRMAALAASFAPDAIADWVTGNLEETPQQESGASVVRPLIKADGWISWDQTAEQISREVRAMQPWPRAWTTTPGGAVLQVLSGEVADNQITELGTVRVVDGQVLVGCGKGGYRIGKVQLAGGSAVPAASLIHGRKLFDGDQLGNLGAPGPLPPLVKHLSD
jgi:methionyl-tRNA formyltransferase